MSLGIVDDARFLDHNRGAGHIEGPERLEVVREMIAAGLPLDWRRIEPQPATDDELGAVHSRGYIELLSRTAGRPYVQLDADTSVTALSSRPPGWPRAGPSPRPTPSSTERSPPRSP